MKNASYFFGTASSSSTLLETIAVEPWIVLLNVPNKGSLNDKKPWFFMGVTNKKSCSFAYQYPFFIFSQCTFSKFYSKKKVSFYIELFQSSNYHFYNLWPSNRCRKSQKSQPENLNYQRVILRWQTGQAALKKLSNLIQDEFFN